MDLSRRDAIKLGVFGAGALILPIERTVAARAPSRMAESRLPAPFTVPFSVPPTVQPVRSDATRDLYQLTMKEQLAEILPGHQTRVWGYDGLVPGPTFDVERGRPIVVRHINQLPGSHPTLGYEPRTSVHLHGSASLPEYDGYASDLTRRGEYKDYRYPNVQAARTLWYHDHGVHQTAPNVYSGLLGMYRVHDPLERSLALPQGRYDVPLIVTDAMFSSDGQLLWDDRDQSGVYGDVILVNGRPWPAMPVERRKYRFRILNASVTRGYRWRLDSGEPLVVVATDGGLMPEPRPVLDFRHGPAERYEVVIDFAQYPVGQRVVLENLSNDKEVDFATTRNVMAFDVVAEPASTVNNCIPGVLNPHNEIMALDPSQATAERRLTLDRQGGEWTINGKTWADVERSGFRDVFARPELGATEIWELRNDSGGWHHPLHIHMIDFKIIDRTFDQTGPAQPPMNHEVGPKDVAYIGENERVRVVAKFTPHPGRYMIHCHNLVHEDHDMMVQFQVGEGGGDPIHADPARPLPAPPL